MEPPRGISVRKYDPHNDKKIPRAPQHEASDFEEGAKDKEDDERTIAQGSTQIMGNTNAVFLEKTTSQTRMFHQVIKSQALLNQRHNVLRMLSS